MKYYLEKLEHVQLKLITDQHPSSVITIKEDDAVVNMKTRRLTHTVISFSPLNRKEKKMKLS